MNFSTRVMDRKDWEEVAPYFKPEEFNHPDRMGYEFMVWMKRVRILAGVPIVPFSDYRSPGYNASIGGAKDSAHTDEICDVMDIKKTPRSDDPHWNYSRFRIIWAVMMLGGVRIGMYPTGSLHVDRTEDSRPSPRLWMAVDNPA